MAGMLKNMFGSGSRPANPDDDFADFVEAPNPSPASLVADSTTIQASSTGTAPFTAWYRVWERTSPRDFMQEAMIMPFILVMVLFHVWGTRKNRRKAREWANAHVPLLQKEFAVVGFDGVARTTDGEAVTVELANPEKSLKEKSANEFSTYATGRQNIAFLDIALKMPKRYNPIHYFMEYACSFFFETWEAPSEKYEAMLYTFDGKEKDLVPVLGNDTSSLKVNNSTYDGFIWAVVHKSQMRKFRTDRYDASITFSKDHPKLPSWVTVMSESAEITETLLTPDLIKAVEQAGNDFEFLIVSDQPVDKPTKIDETVPKKRIQLSINLSSAYSATVPLFNQYLRLADKLVAVGHFRGEVMRKLRNVREEEIKKLRRVEEEEKAEERKITAEKIKKEERERILRGMTADEQRKFLERETAKDQRRLQKKQTRRG
ncbi:hypothetical protein N7448_005384 [Penicillium atrosanguineum]|uniref:Uncharacterized protein n=1 Tax=Penicillium atrosanguineum TaxID=1132637 RepID=A0A9W9U007_9EURO|nr:uncharacterized protein N7443_009115 [Penicillium atrosanguineum]KAJ5126075.1 hypothetical protein N7526_008252 [Penicillium atrosanguineum]KAJ5136830.1 hypothetical protein N7448_005384 [Penicillium atrosanguineum]KAJ5293162.1 hypothetical protein N7443_009115 [Penicillium atrosanguineum]KAJ5302802.1 hypothetical protein N7476_009601 [Penicillium atrosanguineum]